MWRPKALFSTTSWQQGSSGKQEQGPIKELARLKKEHAADVPTAHAEAAQLDIAITAVVVDQSGRMIAVGRMDRARELSPSWRVATSWAPLPWPEVPKIRTNGVLR